MTALEKRKEEQEELLQSRKNRILQSAFNLFSEKGIDTIAMTDIAKLAEIGVASLYRYYETKEEIAIRTAIWAWNQQTQLVLPSISNPDFDKMTGFEQLKVMCSVFVKLCENQRQFLKFIYFFDSYAIRQHISSEKMKDYEIEIGGVQNLVMKALKKGFEDKTINQKYKEKENTLYFTLMHTLFSTAQKLSLSGNMLEMDKVVSPGDQMQFLIDLILNELIVK